MIPTDPSFDLPIQDVRLPAEPTMHDIVQAALRLLMPKKAMTKLNGERAALCVIGPVVVVKDLDGNVVSLEAVNGRYGVAYVRVSTEKQRSRAVDAVADLDLDTAAKAESREEMAGQHLDTAYSEKDQIERGVEYFVSRGEAFYIVSDAGLSGGWPWLNDDLIRDLYQRKARRYERILRKLAIENPKYAAHRPAIERHVQKRIEQYVASVKELDEAFTGRYIRPDRRAIRARSEPKYRPGLTVIVNGLKAVHTIAFSDLSRLCRSYDIQSSLGRLLAKNEIRIVGTIEPLDYLSPDEDEGDQGLGAGVMGFLMGKLAEAYLTTVLKNSVLGQLGALDSRRLLGNLPEWLKRERPGGGRVIADEEAMNIVREAVMLCEQGNGPAAIATKLHERHGKRFNHVTIKDWLRSPLLVGDRVFFGIKVENVAPPVLVDAEGKTDRSRWRMLQRSQDQRAKHHERGTVANPEGNNEPAYLCSAIARCWCGKAVAVKHQPRKEGKAPKMYLQCAGNTAWRRDHPGLHVHLHFENFHAFLGDVIDEQLDGMISQMRDNVQQDALLERVRALEEMARTKERDIAEASTKRRAVAEEEARDWATRRQVPVSESLVLKTLEMLVLPDREELRDIEERLSRERRLLDTFAEQRPSDIEQIRQDFGAAKTPKEQNAILRRVLSMRFTQDGLDAASLQCFIDLKVAAAPPIEVPLEITIHPWKNEVKRLVRFPASADADIALRLKGVTPPF